MRIIKTLVFFILTLCLTQALPFPIQDDNSQNTEFLTQDKILRMRIISDLAELTFASQESRLLKLFCAFRVAAEIDYQYGNTIKITQMIHIIKMNKAIKILKNYKNQTS